MSEWIAALECVQEDRGPSTPLRWRCYIFQDDGMGVAISQGKSHQETLDRGRLIVDAVNQRAALLEALKGMVIAARCENYESKGEPAIPPVGECICDPCDAARKALAAIAQAEKGAA